MLALKPVSPQQIQKQICLGAQADSDSFQFQGLEEDLGVEPLKQCVGNNLSLSFLEFSHTFLGPSTTKFCS